MIKVTFGIVELPKLKTKEERKKSYLSAHGVPPGYKNRLPIWKGLLREEYDFITQK